MLKRLTHKLLILSLLVAAVAAVSTTPASSRQQYICWEMPLDGGCPNNLWCCDASGRECGCG